MPSPPRLPPVYAILDFDFTLARGFTPSDLLDAWLEAGVRLVQFRAKALTLGPFLGAAEPLAAQCRRAGAVFLVNDRADVARLVAADGVHVGQDDLSPADVRALLPEAPWIGLSTHTDGQVRDAMTSAATYIAIGPVFRTSTKANASQVVGLEGVAQARRLTGQGTPLVAIGGITASTAASVLDAGADSVAVVSGLLEGDDPVRAAQAVLRAVT